MCQRAQNRLAWVNLEGGGTGKNLVEAAKSRLIAKRSRLEDLPLDEAIAKLSRTYLQKAEQLASEWSDASKSGRPSSTGPCYQLRL